MTVEEKMVRGKGKGFSGGPPPSTRVKVYWLLRQKPYLTLKEVARILGLSYNAVKLAASRLKRDGVRVSGYCPICLKKTVVVEENEILCTSCGTVLLEKSEAFSFPGKGSYPTNHIQANRGLGSSVEMENSLIRALGLNSISMGYVQTLGFQEPKFFTKVKRLVVELGGFEDWDMELTNVIGRLVEEKCTHVLRTRCEITRKTVRETALQVLAEAYKTWPHRVRIPENVLEEMRKKGFLSKVMGLE